MVRLTWRAPRRRCRGRKRRRASLQGCTRTRTRTRRSRSRNEKSLRGGERPPFTRRMKINAWLGLVAAASLALSSVVFGQTMAMTGKVLTVTSKSITVQTDSGVWEVTRNSGTKVTGDLKVGATVTISCAEPDAQKKEGPAQ